MCWTARAGIVLSLALSSCYGESDVRREARGGLSDPPYPQPTNAPGAAGVPSIELLSQRVRAPTGGDGPALSTLAFRFADGRRVPIDGEAQAYVPFRRGVALVDVRGQLVLVTPEGARSVLARASGAVPALGPRGELAYVARYDDQSIEVHTLGIDGRDRVVARGLGSAGLLAPQSDGRVVFVATPARGGVAGVWIAAEGGGEARCLTNCGLQTGSAALDSRFIPLPGDAASIALAAERVSWHASDGTIRSVSLAVPPAPPDAPTNVDALGGPR